MALADEGSPCFLPGAFQVIVATISANSKIEQRFKTARASDVGSARSPIV
ncbi:MAG TPA: hypothetical protein VK626_09345 [Nitrospiraceae bacterium]|nr:hypothetical protein [Nitrospiraceae bacterium]